MRVFRIVLSWAVISLVVQFLGFYYVNNYFLASNTDIKSTKVTSREDEKSDVEVSIPYDAQNIKVSFDGRYASYYNEGMLEVVDTSNGKEKQVKLSSGYKLSYYKWLPDRNRILIAEKTDTDGSADFKLEYFDIDKGIKENIKKMNDFIENTKIVDIQESPLTNVIYIKMQYDGNRTSIYRVNIMSELQKISTNSYAIGDMGVLSLKDKLVYEDNVYHKIYITGEDEPMNISKVKNPVWIGIDNDDKVYIGDMKNDDKVGSIYYGKIEDDPEQYKKVDLRQDIDKKDIYISDSGRIYVNDNLKGIVEDVLNGKQYVYHGKFVQLYNKGIVSIVDGKVSKTLIN